MAVRADTAAMKSTNQDGRDTMSDEQNIERGEAEGEVEGHPIRWGKNDSEAPETTDLSDADALEESEVEGQGIYRGRDDSEAPENTDVKDSTDDPDVEGQGARWH